MEGWKKISQASRNQTWAEVAMFTSLKDDIKELQNQQGSPYHDQGIINSTRTQNGC